MFMQKSVTVLALSWCLGILCVGAANDGVPKLQFDQTLYDFGKTSQVATVSGVFKFHNAGGGILKLEPPKPSCGCTVAEVQTNSLAAGETGELAFTLNLRLLKGVIEKHISVQSNDPLTPNVGLTIRVDYQPLYDLNPMTLSPVLEFGMKETTQFVSLSRSDGQPLRIDRLETSKPWVTATVEPAVPASGSAARIRVVIQRDGLPRRFNEYVQIYAQGETNAPASSIYVYGQMLGEIAVSPESLYWNVNGPGKAAVGAAEAANIRRLSIRSNSGEVMEVTNVQSTIKGLKVELVPKESGKAYELVARLDEVPPASVAGSITFDTSIKSQPRMEVPLIVNVSKP